MEMLILWIVFVALLFPTVFCAFWYPLKEHRKTVKDCINYDAMMQKFVYEVPMSKNEIIRTLQMAKDIDELKCTFDFELSIIDFEEFGSHLEYYYQIEERADFSVLRLRRVKTIERNGYVPYKLNPFLSSKLNARIVPFDWYRF